MTRDELVELVRETVVEILPGLQPEQVRLDQHLKALGADSVDRVEIILALLHRLGIDEPLSTFSTLPHLGALVDTLAQLAPAGSPVPTGSPAHSTVPAGSPAHSPAPAGTAPSRQPERTAA